MPRLLHWDNQVLVLYHLSFGQKLIWEVIGIMWIDNGCTDCHKISFALPTNRQKPQEFLTDIWHITCVYEKVGKKLQCASCVYSIQFHHMLIWWSNFCTRDAPGSHLESPPKVYFRADCRGQGSNCQSSPEWSTSWVVATHWYCLKDIDVSFLHFFTPKIKNVSVMMTTS